MRDWSKQVERVDRDAGLKVSPGGIHWASGDGQYGQDGLDGLDGRGRGESVVIGSLAPLPDLG
jgi:hypothetical protein